MISLPISNLKIDRIDFSDRMFDLFYPIRANAQISNKPDSLQLPALVQISPSGYRIIIGREWLESRKSDESVPAFILLENEMVINELRISANYVRLFRPLIPTEVAGIVRVLIAQKTARETIAKTLFPEIGLSPNIKLIDAYLNCLNLDPNIAEWLIGKNAPQKTWFALSTLDREFQAELVLLLDKTRPTLSILEEIVRNIRETAIREEMDTPQILTKIGWKTVLENPDLTESDKIASLRQDITRMRFPLLSSHASRAEAFWQKINVPPNVHISYDPTFEKKELTLDAILASPQDINTLEQFFNDDNRRNLNELLENL
ncbi:MAG: hypothetical protein COT43_02410 [Candidatus Marinimicrobia bacterium CG08_land_8_20_14_0_20_45_22]|nr:MAG: hypothetical protein COT43_02410 [Candidatus Marinimicrobia bacterium CG08_land_8_20_14_0_20_45_22]